MEQKLFCFGLGYSAMALARRLNVAGWHIGGTCRGDERKAALAALGIDSARFDGEGPMTGDDTLQGVSHVLVSAPPGPEGDPVLNWHADDLAATDTLEWVGYLSTTGVYGNRDGDWVDETDTPSPSSDRSERRVAAETDWLAWGRKAGKPVQIFRLAGIYGPGRSALDQVRKGTARRIDKPGHLFSRIHVEDIATVLEAAIRRPDAGPVFNVCDDEPAEPAEVIDYACSLLGVEPPPAVPFAEAELSPMAQSFWADHRRVRNDRIKSELDVKLAFPDYRAGIRAIAGL